MKPIFNHLKPKRVLVVGDFFLDTYTKGSVDRVSPEAPVLVVHVQEEQKLPGGAGNVALNLISLGAKVTAMGRLGDDEAGQHLMNLLSQEGIDLHFVSEPNIYTPIKNRIIAENQQIVRVDKEQTTPLTPAIESQICQKLPALLENIDIIAISDYGKGYCTDILLQTVITEAKKRNIPTVVDPKGVDYTRYSHCDVIKPNLKEAQKASGLEKDEPLEDHAQSILQKTGAKNLLITLSDKGMMLFRNGKNSTHFPVVKREIMDVTGAGDTALASFVFFLANQMDIETSIELSNLAAGVAIEHLGCARVTLSQIAKQHLEEKVQSKIYDQSHHESLFQMLKNTPYTLFEFSPSEKLTASLWHALQEASEKGPSPLVVFLPESDHLEELLPWLTSLECVEAIVTDLSSIEGLPETMCVAGRAEIINAGAQG